MNNYLMVCLLAIVCTACSKNSDPVPPPLPAQPPAQTFATPASTIYLIKKGEHNSNASTLQWVDTTKLAVSVRFDSSAMYKTRKPENQYDINKLFGFSDNGAQHHQYSARFGWRWSDGALRLFAYVYNGGKRQEKELGTAKIGAWVHCSIEIKEGQYIFALNDISAAMPRTSTTPKASGYLLYPYFGGDEVAPHDVRIEIQGR